MTPVRLTGTGKLSPDTDLSDVIEVTYDFEVKDVSTPARQRLSTTGVVHSINGRQLPDGLYRLELKDGETMWAKSRNGFWQRVAPPH